MHHKAGSKGLSFVRQPPSLFVTQVTEWVQRSISIHKNFFKHQKLNVLIINSVVSSEYFSWTSTFGHCTGNETLRSLNSTLTQSDTRGCLSNYQLCCSSGRSRWHSEARCRSTPTGAIRVWSGRVYSGYFSEESGWLICRSEKNKPQSGRVSFDIFENSLSHQQGPWSNPSW